MEALPEELLRLICKYLYARDRRNLRLVSRRLADLCFIEPKMYNVSYLKDLAEYDLTGKKVALSLDWHHEDIAVHNADLTSVVKLHIDLKDCEDCWGKIDEIFHIFHGDGPGNVHYVVAEKGSIIGLPPDELFYKMPPRQLVLMGVPEFIMWGINVRNITNKIYLLKLAFHKTGGLAQDAVIERRSMMEFLVNELQKWGYEPCKRWRRRRLTGPENEPSAAEEKTAIRQNRWQKAVDAVGPVVGMYDVEVAVQQRQTEYLESLMKSAPRLRMLSLSYHSYITNWSDFNNLTHLKLSTLLRKPLHLPELPNLQALDLFDLDGFLDNLSGPFKKLQVYYPPYTHGLLNTDNVSLMPDLRVCHCPAPGILDSGFVQEVTRSMKKMRCWMIRLEDPMSLAILEALNSMKELVQLSVQSPAQVLHKLQLPLLEDLHSGKTKLTEEELRILERDCPNLKNVYMPYGSLLPAGLRCTVRVAYAGRPFSIFEDRRKAFKFS